MKQSYCYAVYMQLDDLELKLAESRRQNHDHQNALEQVDTTTESDAALVLARLEEHQRLKRQLETSLNPTSHCQRSFSFDSEIRAGREYIHKRKHLPSSFTVV